MVFKISHYLPFASDAEKKVYYGGLDKSIINERNQNLWKGVS